MSRNRRRKDVRAGRWVSMTSSEAREPGQSLLLTYSVFDALAAASTHIPSQIISRQSLATSTYRYPHCPKLRIYPFRMVPCGS